MNIEISRPEVERMVREEILNGHFNSVDDLLEEALQALREKNVEHRGGPLPVQAHSSEQTTHHRLNGRKSLAQLFAESPLKGLDLKFERDSDTGRPVTL